jgi:DJ-1/PfpI family
MLLHACSLTCSAYLHYCYTLACLLVLQTLAYLSLVQTHPQQQVKDIVRAFFAADKPVAAVCHAAQILAAAGVLRGRTGTAYPAIKSQCVAAGCSFVAPEPITMAHTDGKYVSAGAWPAHPELVKQFTGVLGASVSGGSKRVLAILGEL